MSDILTKLAGGSTPARGARPYIPGVPAVPGHYEYYTYTVPVWAFPDVSGNGGWLIPGVNQIGYGNTPGGPVLPGIPAPYNGATGPLLGKSTSTSAPVYLGTQTYTQTVWIAAKAGTPPIPAQPASASRSDLQLGWNSGAVSINPLTGDGEYQFSISSSAVGVVTGLAGADFGGQYQKFTYALYFANGKFQVSENGVAIGAALSYTSSDVFSIVRVGTRVQYWQGSTLRYTSTISSSGYLYANASMYVAGDAVNNAAFVTSVATSFASTSGSVAATLPSLKGFASNKAGGWEDNGTIKLTSTARANFYANVAAKLKTLKGTSFANGFVEDCQGVLPGLVGRGESGLFTPGFSEVVALLPNLTGTIWANPGNNSVVAKLPGLQGFATNTNGAYEQNGTLKLYSLVSGGGTLPNRFNGTLSGYTLFAQGTQLVNTRYGFFGVLSGFAGSVAAQCGAQAQLALSGFSGSVSSSATVTSLAEANLVGPHCRVLATGSAWGIGRAYLQTNGHYVVTAFGGAQAALKTGGNYVVTGDGLSGAIARANLKLHRCTVVASATQNNFASVAGVLTGLIVNPSAVARIVGPRFQIVATATNAPTPTYEGYSMTLLGEKDVEKVATTHYTEFPFTRIIRFGTKYYGVRADGLFELTGDTFNGDTIYSSLTTGEAEIGPPTLKRTRRLYMSGRMTGSVQVTVSSAELGSDGHSSVLTLTGARNWRVPLGRGAQARYLAFNIQNLDGQDFEINEIGPEVDDLRRTA